MIRDRFHFVRHAVTGARALEYAYDSLPDAFVLDMLLPDMSGLDLARRLRIAFRERPAVVAFSVHDRAFEIAAMLHAGCDAFVAKQADGADALASVLQELLALAPEERAQERLGLFEQAG